MWVSTFHSACVRILRRDADKLGYPQVVHDLRPGRRRPPHRLRHPRPDLDPKRFPPRSSTPRSRAAKNDHLGVDAYAERAEVIYERKIADVYQEYQARLLQGRGHGLRRPALGHRHPVPAATPTCSSTTAAGSSTSSSTSTRTPTRSRTSSSSSWPASTATSASSATATSASRPARWSPRRRAEVPIEQISVGRRGPRHGWRRPAAHRRRSPTSSRADYDGPALLGEGRRPGAPRHPAPHRARRPGAASRPVGRLPDAAPRPRLPHRAHEEPAAESAWVLRASTRSTRRSGSEVCDSAERYWEALVRREYGLPTACSMGRPQPGHGRGAARAGSTTSSTPTPGRRS